jgi:hypothetical protein
MLEGLGLIKHDSEDWGGVWVPRPEKVSKLDEKAG